MVLAQLQVNGSTNLIQRGGKNMKKYSFIFLVALNFVFVTYVAEAQDIWKSNGPYGGKVYSLAINQNGYIFAGTSARRIFRSTDNGSSWTQVASLPTGFFSGDVRSIAINNDGHIFACFYGFLLDYGSIFRSTDNGESWEKVSTDSVDAHSVQSIAISFSGYIFAGTNGGGVFRSIDNGDSWIKVNVGMTDLDVEALAISSNGYIFAGTYGGGVFRSTDNGDSWTSVNSGLTSSFIATITIKSNGHVFVGTNWSGIFRSTDNGDNWTRIIGGLTDLNVRSFAINTEGQLFAGTFGGVFQSTDNGENWTEINTGLTNLNILSLAINSNGHIFASTYGSGVFRSIDSGDSWTAANAGLARVYILSLAFNSSGHIFAGTSGSGVFRSTDNGDSWTEVNAGIGNNNLWALTINTAGYMFAGISYFGGSGAIFRSNDNGDSWIQIYSIARYVRSFVANANGHIFAGTQGAGVFRSLNNGDSWTEVNVGLTNSVVQSLAINSSGNLFAGTRDGGIFRSTNNGDSWTEVNAGLTNLDVVALAISPNGYIFAGTDGGGIFRSTDNGDSWTAVNTGLTRVYIIDLAINSNGSIFTGTSGSCIFRSTNNGDSWTQVNTSQLPGIETLTINLDDYIFVGTNGVYRSVLPTTIPVADFSASPTEGDMPLTVQLTDQSTGQITSWSWDFGDGKFSTDTNPSHTYVDTGIYTLSLTVTGFGGSDTRTKENYITVNEPAPVADFSGSPRTGELPLTVQFSDLSTGRISNWLWNFGDQNTNTEQNPTHTYTEAGMFTVSLKVTNEGGTDTETKTDYINVKIPPPIADFTADQTSGYGQLTVHFTDHSTGQISFWLWDFGDQQTSSEQNPTHTYTEAGIYTVSLTVTGDGGTDTETKTDYITVKVPPPVANFTADQTSGNVPVIVNFTDHSTGQISFWLWDFGDEQTSSEQNPTHNYLEAGIYTVSLTVTGDGGTDTDIKTNYIAVSDPTNIAEHEINEHFKIYPNPANSFCTINLRDLKTSIVSFKVYNSKGELVLIIHNELTPGNSQELGLDISKLPAGLYYILMNTDSDNSAQKLMILR
jgi:PKD repeat protein